MKLWAVFRFELAYQIRRLTPWLSFMALTVVAVLFVRGNYLSEALYDDFYLNAPIVIASVTVFGSLFWFITSAMVAGELAARDVETGMHPLSYTAPLSKTEYLGGRFLAALTLNLLIMLAVPLGVVIAVYGPGVDSVVVGPFRPAAYLTAYGFIAIPNAFVGTSIQFAFAALGRRAIAGYLGSVILFFLAYGGMLTVSYYVEREELAMLLDVFGHVFLTSDLVLGWTPAEKNTRLIELEGTILHSRLLWSAIAVAVLAFTHSRFRFAHPSGGRWRLRRGARGGEAAVPIPGGGEVARKGISIPAAAQTFDLRTQLRQMLAIAWTSFRTIIWSRIGLAPLAIVPFVVVMVLPENLQNLGTPILPRAAHLLTFLTTPLTNVVTPWVLIPLLIVVYTGEVVWRERQAGLGEISDAAPVPEWVTFTGKFLGVALLVTVWMAVLMLAGIAVQLRLGYHDFELGLYLKILFGIQLVEYLLFVVLALVIQGVVSQKYVGHFATLLVYALIAFAPELGARDPLLVYSAGPWWSYSDMRGFGPTLERWMWLKLYWVSWALLLAVVARLLWVRGLERGIDLRLQLARLRVTRATVRAAALAAGLVLLLGGFVFYNTHVLTDFTSAADRVERQAEYERRYAPFRDMPQPVLTGSRLNVEIYPERRELQVSGTYRLVNRTPAVIETIHIASVPELETGELAFDRPATPVVSDSERGHHIYVLDEALQPGDSLMLSFEVQVESRGFASRGYDASVMENGTYFTSTAILPSIGYQSNREILQPSVRREHGLQQRPLLPTLHDTEARGGWPSSERISFEAVLGTDAQQTAVAPGVLRRSWTAGGRRYFHYVTDAPIGEEQAFFSARYALREARWNDVTIQIFHHPGHTANLGRMLRSVQASLDYYSENFGPYRYAILKLVENPSRGFGAHAEPGLIDYGEGYSLFNPELDPRGIDLPFAVMGHEMAHQFCCAYAPVEGAGLLTESPAWWAAMGVVERTYGPEHLERLRRFFRQPSPIPPIRQSVPLLRGMDPYAAYRKGPFALYAMGEYMGHERVFEAYRRVMEMQRTRGTLPTSLDLYRELQLVTPDSLRTLLHDLFAANTFWELQTERAVAERTDAGSWEVTLDLRARKVVVDPAGTETERPLDEWIPIGVFASAPPGADFGRTLYLRMHRIRTGQQTITVTVTEPPSDAGIDPLHLLIELERFDNVEEVDVQN